MTPTERQTILAAASLLYREGRSVTHSTLGFDSPSDEYESMLCRQVEKATQELEDYRRGRGLRLALDALLPGWFDIDASNHLPRKKWNAFVSNDPDEWSSWLLEQGVPPQAVDELMKEQRS